jgi:serine protease Do
MSRIFFQNKARLGLVALALLAIVGLIGAGSLAVEKAQPISLSTHASQPSSPAAQKGASYAKTLSTAFREAASKVLPSVVMITNTPAVNRQSDDSGGSEGFSLDESPFGDLLKNDPRFRDFFHNFPKGMPSPHQDHRGVRGMGSGVVIDPSGIILTNNHVVDGGGKITVRLSDGREFEASEVKTDPKTDLAIVRINSAGTLTAATLGNSDELEVGDWVLALGEPFGLEGTVTAGIISAKGRSMGITARESFLQTDAAINPGNSGGPLVNLDGEVVGINTAISTESGGNQGVGFAVPANLARWVAAQLIHSGSVRRAYLGVLIQPVTQPLAEQFGLKDRHGAIVAEILPDGPAAKAGVQTGDVILEFAGHEVKGPAELQGMVEQAPIGQRESLVVLRDGKRVTLDFVTSEMPANAGVAHGNSHSQRGGESSRFDKLGLQVETLTSELAEQLGVKAASGVVITNVAQGSLADMAGLSNGNVITEVNRKPVKSVDDFRRRPMSGRSPRACCCWCKRRTAPTTSCSARTRKEHRSSAHCSH